MLTRRTTIDPSVQCGMPALCPCCPGGGPQYGCMGGLVDLAIAPSSRRRSPQQELGSAGSYSGRVAGRLGATLMPAITETFFAESRGAWRRWLATHHENTPEIWLIFLKKHVERPCVTYDEAVEEALCFGWIDGILKRIDGEKHTVRFSPRKPSSKWSASNKRRVERMIAEGQMTPAGMARVEDAKKRGAWQNAYGPRKPMRMPADLRAALTRNKRAQINFDKMTAGQRRDYIGWVLDAKRDETRRKRIRAVVSRAAENKKPGML